MKVEVIRPGTWVDVTVSAYERDTLVARTVYTGRIWSVTLGFSDEPRYLVTAAGNHAESKPTSLLPFTAGDSSFLGGFHTVTTITEREEP